MMIESFLAGMTTGLFGFGVIAGFLAILIPIAVLITIGLLVAQFVEHHSARRMFDRRLHDIEIKLSKLEQK